MAAQRTLCRQQQAELLGGLLLTDAHADLDDPDQRLALHVELKLQRHPRDGDDAAPAQRRSE